MNRLQLMPQTFRIGSQIGPYDPFWVQVREAVSQKAQQLGLELIPLEIAGRLTSPRVARGRSARDKLPDDQGSHWRHVGVQNLVHEPNGNFA